MTVTGCSEGTLIVRLRVNGVTDLAGNGNAVTNGATVTIDRTAPTVTINQAVGQADPTNAEPDRLHGGVQRDRVRLRHR